MARLFLAVWPPPHVVTALEALHRPATSGVRWTSAQQRAVKVRPLGPVSGTVVPQLVDVLAAELDGAPAPRCELGPATHRLGGQWLGVPVHGLGELAAAVFEATEGLVPVTHPQPFRADVALARGRVPKELAGIPVRAAWTADVLMLTADRSSPQGVRFEHLAEFPLGA